MAKTNNTAALDANYEPTILTDDELEKQEANVAATRAARAEAARIAREEYLAPMIALVSGDGFRDFLSGLRDVREQYANDTSIAAHVDAILMFLPALARSVGVETEAPIVAPETTPEA